MENAYEKYISSAVADFEKIPETLKNALTGKQLEPMIF